jgi:hypothetical protein
VAAAPAVRPPDPLGRWRHRRQKVIDELNVPGGPGLARFGYLDEP